MSLPSNLLSSRLLHLKAAQLKRLAFLIGANSTGTKPILLSSLQSELATPRLRPQAARSRILSIDLGIRNLAYCVLDVRMPPRNSPPSHPAPTTPRSDSAAVKVIAWKRIAVLRPRSPPSSPASPIPLLPRKDKEEEKEKEAFDPKTLARAAYTLLTSVLLPYSPSAILIERQRYRSGGGAAVQEWTVRVNMFESIIYGVLETLRQVREGSKENECGEGKRGEGGEGRFADVCDVSPKRVAEFWLRGDGAGVDVLEGEKGTGTEKAKAKGRSKITKKEKIELVARWLDGGARGAREPGVPELEFSDEAARTRVAFTEKKGAARAGGKKAAGRENSERGGEEVPVAVVDVVLDGGTTGVEVTEAEEHDRPGKLDDFADCLLQGMAWVKWEANRRAIVESESGSGHGAVEDPKPEIATPGAFKRKPRSRPKAHR